MSRRSTSGKSCKNRRQAPRLNASWQGCRTRGQSSAAQRNIFATLRKSPDGTERDAVETARLAGRLRVLRFTDYSEGDYINLCAEIVRGGTVAEGARLWSRLLQIASENRVTGGYFDVPKLIHILRPDFELQDHPEFASDWTKLGSVASDNIKSVRNVIGNGIHLGRADAKALLQDGLNHHKALVVAGESGSG